MRDILPLSEMFRDCPDGVYYLGRHHTWPQPLTPQILEAYCVHYLDSGREVVGWVRLCVIAQTHLAEPEWGQESA